MGLGDLDLLDDGGGGGRGKGTPVAVSCSICLEAVTDNGERSWAKLQCGHQFHLDCIGSAFNSKGAMQCPNCRKIEKGQWLYANCSRPQPDLSMDDWPHEEDLYDISFSEMSFGVHWCPFSGLTRLPSSFDEGDFSSRAYHDLFGQHTIFAEHTAGSSTNLPCPPFIAYIGPIRPSSSNSSGNVSDGSNLNSHWSGPSIPNQPSIHSVTQRTARTNSDMPRPGSFMHPFLVSHSSASRAPSSVTSSVIPPYSGSVTRGLRDRVQSLRGYYQQPSSNAMARTPLASLGQRSNGHRGLAQVAPVASTSDQSSGFYFFSSGSSGRTFPEGEQPIPNRYSTWEREHLPSFQVDRESIWGPFYPTASGSDTGIRSSSYRQRHGSERVLSQNRL
ncbi:RING/U-box superfamily protein [Abeliophyllum distichum]|uniref:RING/U-box superfamily protein n=1 Tax=Abeliophyllum distichum TaxID=126358 RepID=A0ABD1RP38_9LAMI